MNISALSEQGQDGLQFALNRLSGDVELLHEMIGFYLEDYQMLLQGIDSAVDSGDPTTLSRHVHSLKGLAANLEGTAVVETADNVTRAALARYGRAPRREIALLAQAAEELAWQLRKAHDCEDFD